MDSGPEPKDVTRLLAQLKDGNEEALRKLMPLVYSELKRLASYYLQAERGNHTLQATALVHEAYVRLAGQKETHWQSKEQFVRLASSMMRRVLVDYSRKHRAAKRGGGGKIFLEEASLVAGGKAADVVAVDDALKRLADFDAEQARLVELRFFGGLSIEETAGVLDVSPATVKRNWNVAKAWLARELARGQGRDA